MTVQLFTKSGGVVATVDIPVGAEIIAHCGAWFRLVNGVFVESVVYTA